MIKSYIIRLFPTKEQEQLLWQHIGASRFIWNYMLDLQEKRYAEGEKHLSAFGMGYVLTEIKKKEEYEWLKSIALHSLQTVCADLAKSYDSFFKKQKGHPHFKSRKKSKPIYPLPCDVGGVWFSENEVQIPKIGKIKYHSNYVLPYGRKQKFINPRISYSPNGKWLLSFGMECESQVPVLNDFSMGIDLGVKELAVAACGDERLVFHNKNKSSKVRKIKNKLKHLQRVLARKYRVNGNYKETANVRKLKNKIKRLSFHIANVQKDYLHKTTHELVNKLPKRVVMETLNVQGMMKNRHLARAIQEQCFYEFMRQMKYKCEWNGIEFVQVDRFFPSSKTCSCCGTIKKDLKLKDRVFKCSECGNTIDRDYNAALNLMRYEV